MSSAVEQEFEWSLKGEYELHPAGEWKAVFTKWERDEHEKFGVQAKLTFETEVVDDDGERRKMTCWAKPSLHPKSKIAKLLAALGHNPQQWTEEQVKSFSLTKLVGSKVRIVVAHEKKKDGGADEYVDRITSFLPFKKAAVKTAAFEDEAPAAAAVASMEADAEQIGKAAAAPPAEKKQKAAAAAAPAPAPAATTTAAVDPFDEED